MCRLQAIFRCFSAQRVLLDVVRDPPEVTLNNVRKLTMPRHHNVQTSDVDLKRLGAVLAAAYQRELHDFASLLLLERLGPRTLQSSALVAEVIHGATTRFSDPARYSFGHGGTRRTSLSRSSTSFSRSSQDLRRNHTDPATVAGRGRESATQIKSMGFAACIISCRHWQSPTLRLLISLRRLLGRKPSPIHWVAGGRTAASKPDHSGHPTGQLSLF
jgi:hypothetical protein